jgi:hypothetical protein
MPVADMEMRLNRSASSSPSGSCRASSRAARVPLDLRGRAPSADRPDKPPAHIGDAPEFMAVVVDEVQRIAVVRLAVHEREGWFRAAVWLFAFTLRLN